MSIPYIGSRISLVSKSDIRYEGILYTVDPKEQTVALQHVRSFGTEGRKKDGPQIPPSQDVFGFIIFRGSDIKDLHVCEPPPPPVVRTSPHDPAIIAMPPASPANQPPGVPPQGMYPGGFGLQFPPGAPMGSMPPAQFGPYGNPGFPYWPGGSYYGPGPQQYPPPLGPNAGQPLQQPPLMQPNGHPSAGQGPTANSAVPPLGATPPQPQVSAPSQPTAPSQPVQIPSSPVVPVTPSPQPPVQPSTVTQAPPPVQQPPQHTPTPAPAVPTTAVAPTPVTTPTPTPAQPTKEESKPDGPERTYANAHKSHPHSGGRQPHHQPRRFNGGSANYYARQNNQPPQPTAQPPLQPAQQPQQHPHRSPTNNTSGGHAPRRRTGRPPVNTSTGGAKLEEFDFESSNARFDKEKVMEEVSHTEKPNLLPPSIVEAVTTEKQENEITEPDKSANPTAYNKTLSFFDNISCEALERSAEKDRQHPRQSYAEQRKIDAETFGLPPRGGPGGYRGGPRRGPPPPRGPPGNHHRGQGYQTHQPPSQAKVFRPVQTTKSNSSPGAGQGTATKNSIPAAIPKALDSGKENGSRK
jgi:protein LSM14